MRDLHIFDLPRPLKITEKSELPFPCFFFQIEIFVHKNTVYTIIANQNMLSKWLLDTWAIEKILHSCVSHAKNVCKSQNTLEFCFRQGFSTCYPPGTNKNHSRPLPPSPV